MVSTKMALGGWISWVWVKKGGEILSATGMTRQESRDSLIKLMGE